MQDLDTFSSLPSPQHVARSMSDKRHMLDNTMKVCNLELLSEVASMAKDLLASGKSINMLINNAGR